jgi:hypothetical protein
MAKRKTKPWWPKTVTLQLSFWANFILKLSTYKTRLNISDDQINSIIEDEAVFRYLFTYDVTFRIFMAAFLTYRKNIMKGKTPADIGLPPVCPITIVPAKVLSALLNRLFAFVALIKAQPKMTIAIRKDLQIVGGDIPPFIQSEYFANGSGKVTLDGIVFNFIKGLFIEGMAIFMQRAKDPEFYEVIRIYKKGYVMNIENLLPGLETRNFYFRAIIDNKLIGKPSPVFSVIWYSPPPPEVAVKGNSNDTKEPKI